MVGSMLRCVAILALVAAAAPARSGERAVSGRHGPDTGSSPTRSIESDCETSLRTLDASQAEGEERLVEKHAVIDTCASQYKNDKMVRALVKECAKYEEQPVVKQQFVADCQLAAFNYANALYSLKAEYGQ
ncbi:MAG: hypothetical protein WAV27_05555 [Xanthobacteraceae bacterium]